ncbi:MAG: FKBP-type peptidyl-prolyl cis-trans isomerase [Woeseia sp.]|nr:FKBP-type peptidyl-prolyl cis-trans isomerase [Woeseia sp.]MBT8095479.1 FKBP-type peptidyl-prolyl cis-trans isomerase [Woeseia sp.]NNE61030.1 FKBP-type peptidyl-prolyl cis-trans isomerase [Woeseia sp.]NNL55022.1 FKBP-type peptidyl-prolyl cis-trans isomerase [Woeseia sp.]
MKILKLLLGTLCLVSLVACGKSEPPAETMAAPEPAAPASVASDAASEIAPGLTMRVIRVGDGPTAAAGDTAVVHYTGWLFDETAENMRGEKFDSSVDRGQHFRFPLGAGRVIKGWDQGVAGMQVGEVRELTIAPELAYGERGAGAVIPPGATLVFEVELAGVENPADPR